MYLHTFTHLSSCHDSDSCPAPPELSVNDLDSFLKPKGQLESDNTYVAEHLMRQAGEQLPSVFFRRVQAGFVFGYNEHVDRDLKCLSDTPSQQFSLSTRNLTATIWYNNQVSHMYTCVGSKTINIKKIIIGMT